MIYSEYSVYTPDCPSSAKLVPQTRVKVDALAKKYGMRKADEEEKEKCIVISATDTDVCTYSIKNDHGNIYLYSSVRTLDTAFDLLVRDIEGGKVCDRSGRLPFSVPYTKDDVIRLFDRVYNTDGKVISGCHTYGTLGNGSDIKETDDRFLSETGKRACILELDMGVYSVFNPHHSGVDTLDDYTLSKIISEAADFVSDGGIVSVCIHMSNPLQNASDNVFYRGNLGSNEKARELISDGTPLNIKFRKTLEPTIRLLNALKKNGIPFMFRPLHEMNGGWFWWCVKQGGDVSLSKNTMHDFWKLFRRIVTEDLGIDNAVWVYSPNYNGGWLEDVMYAYPGDEYVDIVGCDWYTGGNYEVNADESYSKVMQTGKPAALTEVGPGASLTIKDDSGKGIGYNYSCLKLLEDMKRMEKDGFKLTYFLTWAWGLSVTGLGDGRQMMNDDMVITLEDLWK